MASGSALASDLEVSIWENPKPSNGVSVTVARAATHHLHVIISHNDPTNLLQLLFAEQGLLRPAFSLHPRSTISY